MTNYGLVNSTAWHVRIIIDEVVPEKGFQFLFQSVGAEVEMKLR